MIRLTYYIGCIFLFSILQIANIYGQAEYAAKNRFLIKYKQSFQQTDWGKVNAIRSFLQVDICKRYKEFPLEIWEFPEDIISKYENGTEDLLRFLQTHLSLEYIEPDYFVKSDTVPNDSLFIHQYGLHNSGQNGCSIGNDIRASQAWQRSTGSKSTVVGVLDSGIDWAHPDLINNIWQNLGEDSDGDGHTIEWNNSLQKWEFDPGDIDTIDNDHNGYLNDFIGWDFVNDDNNPYDDLGHGTHVAGIIGAEGNNQIGISGVMWQTQMMPLKVLDERGSGSISNIVDAIFYSLKKGVKLTNNSYSMPGFVSTSSHALYDAIKIAKDSNQVFITGAGNNGQNIDVFPVFPACYELPNIITVGAINCHDQLPSFTNFGRISVDLFAPGEGIYSTQPGNSYRFNSGTSMAAPFVTGVCGLILSQDSTLSYLELRNTLLFNVERKESLTGKCNTDGKLNAQDALEGKNAFDPRGSSHGWQRKTADEYVFLIYHDGDFMYIPTRGGVRRINKQTFEVKHFTADQGLDWYGITTIAKDQNDQFWFLNTGSEDGSGGNEFGFFNDTTWETFPGAPMEIQKDSSGNLWRMIEPDFYKYDGMTWVQEITGLPSGVFGMESRFTFGQNGKLWLAHRTGLYRRDSSVWTHVINAPNGQFPAPNKIVSDQNNHFWVISNHEIWESNGASWIQHIPWPTGWPVSTEQGIKLIEVAPNNDIWVATRDSGLAIYNGSTWTKMRTETSIIPSNQIEAMDIDDDGKVWIGTTPLGIYRYDDTVWTAFEEGLGDLKSYTYFDFANGHNGEVWIGTPTGLVKYFANSFETLDSLNSGLPFNYVSSVSVSQTGTVYAGINRHGNQINPDTILAAFDGQNWSYWDTTNSIFPYNTKITRLYTDSQNRLWVGTMEHGLFTLVNSTLTKASSNVFPYPSPYPLIYSIQEGPDSSIWIGNGTNLLQVNKDTSIQHTMPSVSPGQAYASIAIGANYEIYVIISNPPLYLTPPLTPPYTNINNHAVTNALFTSSDTGKTWTEIPSVAFNSYAEPANILYHTSGTYWISTGYDLRRYIPGQGWAVFDSLSPNIIFLDHNDNIWSSTSLSTQFTQDVYQWYFNNDIGLLITNPSFLSAYFSSDQSVFCIGEQGIFNNQSIQADSFRWEVNGIYASNDTNLNYTFQLSGPHEIRLSVLDGPNSWSFSQTVEVRPTPDVDLGPDTTICSEAIYLQTSVSALTYHWQNIGGDTVGREPGAVIDTSGIYILEVNDACGASDRDTILVTLTEDPIHGSCVLPGDVDGNGWVNILDFLALCAVHGQTGPPRPDSSLNWTPQPAPDWPTNLPNNIAVNRNMKHADCDGNGVINAFLDYLAIILNAQGSHNQGVQTTSETVRLRLKAVHSEVILGDTIRYDIILDNVNGGIVNDVYSLAFTLEHSSPLNQNPILDLTNSWMGIRGIDTHASFILFSDHFDIGICKVDTPPPSNAGKLAELAIAGQGVSIDTSRNVRRIFFSVNSINPVLLQPDGTPIPITALSGNMLETVTIEIPWTYLDLKAYLQGPFDPQTGLMHTTLRDSNYIPLIHPYPDVYQPKPDSLPQDMVDWVLVELRSANDSSQIFSKRAAYLMSDGSIIDPEGGGPLAVIARSGDYYIAIKHRNHLAMMSASPITLEMDSLQNYDFSTAVTQAFGNNSQVTLDIGLFGMYAGDLNQDGKIIFQGPGRDWDVIIQNANPTNVKGLIMGYHAGDSNLDGIASYSGINNDRAIILKNVGVNTPSNKLLSKVPQ